MTDMGLYEAPVIICRPISRFQPLNKQTSLRKKKDVGYAVGQGWAIFGQEKRSPIGV
jgi:hypothetical protein